MNYKKGEAKFVQRLKCQNCGKDIFKTNKSAKLCIDCKIKNTKLKSVK